MQITKTEMLDKYGISLSNGKYAISDDGTTYSVSTVQDDTDGCILVGTSCDALQGTIGSSRIAYQDLYVKAVEALERGEKVSIQII